MKLKPIAQNTNSSSNYEQNQPPIKAEAPYHNQIRQTPTITVINEASPTLPPSNSSPQPTETTPVVFGRGRRLIKSCIASLSRLLDRFLNYITRTQATYDLRQIRTLSLDALESHGPGPFHNHRLLQTIADDEVEQALAIIDRLEAIDRQFGGEETTVRERITNILAYRDDFSVGDHNALEFALRRMNVDVALRLARIYDHFQLPIESRGKGFGAQRVSILHLACMFYGLVDPQASAPNKHLILEKQAQIVRLVAACSSPELREETMPDIQDCTKGGKPFTTMGTPTTFLSTHCYYRHPRFGENTPLGSTTTILSAFLPSQGYPSNLVPVGAEEGAPVENVTDACKKMFQHKDTMLNQSEGTFRTTLVELKRNIEKRYMPEGDYTFPQATSI